MRFRRKKQAKANALTSKLLDLPSDTGSDSDSELSNQTTPILEQVIHNLDLNNHTEAETLLAHVDLNNLDAYRQLDNEQLADLRAKFLELKIQGRLQDSYLDRHLINCLRATKDRPSKPGFKP